ncbi:FAD-linked oxidase, partial [Sulfolobus sp. F1]
ITLCPLAAAKFRSVGINAITLIEFLAEKLGIQSPEYQVITFKLSEKDKEYIKSLLLSSLLGSLNARADVIADTATFSTSGLDEYKKIIEPIVSESVDEIAKSISAKLYDTIKSLITEKSSSKPIIIAEYIRELSNVLSTIELDKAIQPFMTLLRSKIKEEYDEKVVSLALIQLLRENEERLKNILSTELNKM